MNRRGRMFRLRHSNLYWVVFLANKINDFKWWVLHRVHPRYRFHVHKYHRLPPGWHDVDYRMLHACFDLFTEFVEKEKGLETLKAQFTYAERDGVFDKALAEGSLDAEGYEYAKHIYSEAKDLYEWWQSKSNEEISDLEFGYSKEHDTSNVCNDQLVRLMKIRRYLWT